MIVCVPVTADGMVDPRWGRATRVAIATVQAGRIADWRVVDVHWDDLHDVGTEGGHHARVATFLRGNRVGMVVAGHMGEPMRATLGQMDLAVRLGATGDARRAVLAAAQAPN
jgi:predicted Fe-Mo cluster-binding NifX family protein